MVDKGPIEDRGRQGSFKMPRRGWARGWRREIVKARRAATSVCARGGEREDKAGILSLSKDNS